MVTTQRILTTLLLVTFLASCVQTASPTPGTATSTSLPSATETFSPTPAPALAPMTDFMKGIVYYPASWGGDQRPETEWILRNIALPTGANWIRINQACFQNGIESTRVYCKSEEGFSDRSYIHFVQMAHSMGLRVLSEHMIDSSGWESHWAGDIGDQYDEQQWAEWFASYGEMILHYAQLAETAGTDYLVIASELDSTAHREKEWRELIARVREVYHGKISMAFSEEGPLREVQFWDALDSIDIHPYYLDLEGVTDPTVEQLTQAFVPHADRLEALSKQWDRPILISEIGYWSVHTISQDYNNLDSSNQIDLQEQRDLYQAVFNAFYGKEWLEGIFWFAMEGSSNLAEPWNIHNDFIGKPAEDVVRSYYGASPRPTSTPIIFPDDNLPNIEVIYDDKLGPSWNYNLPDGDPDNIQLDQSEISVNGLAIAVQLYHFWSLDFKNYSVDWSKYQWLEFDLYVEPQDLPEVYTIGVLLRDVSYFASLYRVELLQSQFIEGGTIQPGTWQHVQIPIDAFGPLISEYTHISIDQPGVSTPDMPITIYLDNIILRGK